jgi:hypothetical protein
VKFSNSVNINGVSFAKFRLFQMTEQLSNGPYFNVSTRLEEQGSSTLSPLARDQNPEICWTIALEPL